MPISMIVYASCWNEFDTNHEEQNDYTGPSTSRGQRFVEKNAFK